ncbi:glycosyltransferase family 39 protein [Streptomyces sp. NPDC001380]|uniref:glycosyltransferase family 39 protein n=1 Tax=Streptomyces sp. NPDC001380 TaxID=3364566 RepID=UPI0036A279B8
MSLAAAAVMLAVGLWGLDRGSMWRDEEATFDAAHRTVPQLLAMVRHVDAVHAAYYLLMHVWMLPGGGEVWMRVPSVLGAAAAAALVAALGARLLRPRAGLSAGLLFAATPLVTFYAQEGRSYALVCAAVLLATYCLVRAVEAPEGRRWWAGYAAAAAAASLLHEFAVLALAAHAATLLLSRVPRRVWLRWAAAAAACCAVLAPLALYSRRQSGQVGWLERPGWDAVWGLVRSLAGPAPAAVAAVLVLAVAGAVLPPRGRGPLNLAAVAAPLAVVPPALLLLASQVRPVYHERYVLFCAAGLPLLAAAGAERAAALLRFRGAAALLAAAAVAAAVLPQLPRQSELRTLQARPDDLAGAARAVAAGARPGDGVVFLTPNYRAVELAYPGAFRDTADVALERTPLGAANLRGTERSRREVRRAVLARDRIWLVGRAGLRVRGGDSGARNKKDVLGGSYRTVTTVHVHGLDVRLYERKEKG